jgi:hypothetical protein
MASPSKREQTIYASVYHVETSWLCTTPAARTSGEAGEVNRIDLVVCRLLTVGIRSEASNNSTAWMRAIAMLFRAVEHPQLSLIR